MTYNSLIEQFRSFYFRNYPNDMEQQIEYFAVFGGLGWGVDTSRPIIELIQELILENFDILHQKMQDLIMSKKSNKRLLTALATGDRRIFSAFNKAHINNVNGGLALNYLEEKGLIHIEYSREEPARSLNPKGKLKREVARHRISHKVLFCKPFIRFWFYFIAPHIKEIKKRNYDEFIKSFQTKQNSYTSLVFEELSEVLLNYNLRDSQILSSGSYWDAKIEIDILTITDDEKSYVAECKWKNHKITKKELHKLIDKCERLDIKPTQLILFSKRGFSKELLSMQSKELALYSCKDFEALVKHNSKELLIDNFIS